MLFKCLHTKACTRTSDYDAMKSCGRGRPVRSASGLAASSSAGRVVFVRDLRLATCRSNGGTSRCMKWIVSAARPCSAESFCRWNSATSWSSACDRIIPWYSLWCLCFPCCTNVHRCAPACTETSRLEIRSSCWSATFSDGGQTLRVSSETRPSLPCRFFCATVSPGSFGKDVDAGQQIAIRVFVVYYARQVDEICPVEVSDSFRERLAMRKTPSCLSV